MAWERGGLSANGTEIRSFLDRVLTAFTECDVDWALLRGRDELATGRDVDLLVEPAHMAVVEQIVFELGGVPLPQLKYPWHRMYVLDVPGSAAVLKLDIVHQLVYSRELRLVSDLARGCLDRRVRDDGGLVELSRTDAFWTILLHCVLDKRRVMGHRADELVSLVDDLTRPSPGEELFAGLCPPEWSPQRAIECVTARDWEPLGRLGSDLLSRGLDGTWVPRGASAPRQSAVRETLLRVVDRALRIASRRAAYPHVWGATGLVVIPEVLDVLEKAAVDATVTRLRRRPGHCDIVLVVEDDQLPRLTAALRRRYRLVGGSWRRLGPAGVESVRVERTSEQPPSQVRAGAALAAPMPLPGRSHGRLAPTPGTPRAMARRRRVRSKVS